MNSFRMMRVLGAVAALVLAMAEAQEPERAPQHLGSSAEIVRTMVIPAEVAGMSNASQTSDHKIYFGGQPTKDALDSLTAKDGVKVVINLRQPGEVANLSFDEKAAVEAGGAKYLHTPMGSELPTAEALKPVFDALDRAGDERVLLHCASSNRVGAVWALYAGTRGGLSVDDAIEQGKRAGMKATGLEAAVRKRLTEDAPAH